MYLPVVPNNQQLKFHFGSLVRMYNNRRLTVAAVSSYRAHLLRFFERSRPLGRNRRVHRFGSPSVPTAAMIRIAVRNQAFIASRSRRYR